MLYPELCKESRLKKAASYFWLGWSLTNPSSTRIGFEHMAQALGSLRPQRGSQRWSSPAPAGRTGAAARSRCGSCRCLARPGGHRVVTGWLQTSKSCCGWTKSWALLEDHGIFIAFGTYSGIIIPGLLRWCDMDFVHPQ